MKMRFSRVAIIAGDAELGELVSRHFRKPGTYTPMFEAIRPRMEKWGGFDTDYIRICNAVSFSEPDFIVVAGCDEARLQKIRQRLSLKPGATVIELSDYDLGVLSDLPGYRETGRLCLCNEAKSCRPNTGHVIVVEDANPLAVVLARNLATAESASVVMIPAVSKETVDWFWDQQRTWMNSSSGAGRNEAWNSMRHFIERQLGNICTDTFNSVSFMTRGVPYGLWPFRFPTTHYFTYPILGVNIITGMQKSCRQYLRCPCVYLCDPAEFGDAEFQRLHEIFGETGYVLRQSYGKNATVRTARFLSQHFPLDFIFFATHCGEVQGRRIWEKFSTADGREHKIVFDLVAGLSPCSRTGLVEVLEGKHWISVDDVSWTDNEGKTRIEAGKIIEEYILWSKRRSMGEQQAAIIKSTDAGVVKGSDSLKMHDSYYMPALHNVGGYKFPLVFNNACSSWRRFASAFSYAGASVYIGAGCDVPNSLATEVVSRFALHAARGRAAGPALFRAQKRFVKDLGCSPYLMCGYLFSCMRPPGTNPENWTTVRDEIMREIDGLKTHLRETKSEEIKRNKKEVIEDLEEELRLLEK